MPGTNPNTLGETLMMLQNPGAAMQLQQQQALAAQLMNAQAPDPYATAQGGPLVGGTAIKTSPITDASAALSKVLGAYLMKNTNQKYADAMTQAIQSPSQSSVSNDSASSVNELAPVTGNVVKDNIIHTLYGDRAYADMVTSKLAGQTERAKATNQLTTGTYTDAQGKVHEGVPMIGGIPLDQIPNFNNPGNPSEMASSSNTIAPSMPVKTANLSPMGNTENLPSNIPINAIPSIPPAPSQMQIVPAPEGATSPPSPPGTMQLGTIAGTKEGQIAEATKNAENLADAQKTFTVAASNLPRALSRFDELRKAAPLASYGYGVDNEDENGWAQKFAQQFEPNVAAANAKIRQASNQGILAELGPQLAGLRGNKFLETIASGASGLNLADPPQTKSKVINGLQDQYIANLKSLAAQRRQYGDSTAPSDNDIDKMVVSIAPVPSNAISHLKANPSLAPQFEEKYGLKANMFLGKP